MNNVDGLEELVLRLDADAVVPWFEAHTSGTPEEVHLYHRWLRTRGADEAARATADLSLRLGVLRHLADTDNADAGGRHRSSRKIRAGLTRTDAVRENTNNSIKSVSSSNVDTVDEYRGRTA